VSKVKPLLPGPVAAARRVLDECDVRHPRDIHVEAIAARYGAIVVYAPMDTARGALVRSANRAVIWIDQDAEGEAHARFTGAHEFAHFLRPSQLGNWWETRISSVVGTRPGASFRGAWRVDGPVGVERPSAACRNPPISARCQALQQGCNAVQFDRAQGSPRRHLGPRFPP